MRATLEEYTDTGNLSTDQDGTFGLPVVQAAEDWSFASLSRAETHWGPHGYHRYPAKFIPQLTRKLIDRYSQHSDLVADQFLGSGTTGVEALRAGRRFFGSDISPVAVLISQAKCLPIPPSELDATWKQLNSKLNDLPIVPKRHLTDAEKSAIEAIDISHAAPNSEERFRYWFPEAHRSVLEKILNAIKAVEQVVARTFYLCAFSNTLRGCSIWLSGSTKAQKDLTKILANPADAFRSQAGNMFRRNKLYWKELENAGLDPANTASRYAVAVADARCLPLADASVDLLLTSPPYSTCYEYAELHQLTRLWFERHGLISVETGAQQAYIGSKGVSGRKEVNILAEGTESIVPGIAPNTSASTPYHISGSAKAEAAIVLLAEKAKGPIGKNKSVSREVRALHNYFQDMQNAIAEAARVVAPGKYMVLVIGDTKKRGITIPTSDALTEMACAAGFGLERKIVREIPVRILTTTRDQATGRFTSTAESDSKAYPEEDILIFRRMTTPPKNDNRDG